VELIGWVFLGAGVTGVLAAVVARLGAGRGPAAPSAPAETGLIHALPAGVPPQDGRPGMLRTLDGTVPGARELAITLLDFATRGFVVLEPAGAPTPGGPPDWTIRPVMGDTPGLLRFEQTLLDALHAGTTPEPAPPQTLSALARNHRPDLMAALDQLKASPRAVGWVTTPRRRGAWAVLGGVIVLAGLVGLAVNLIRGFGVSLPWPGLVGAALLVVSGVILVGQSRMVPVRTPAGDAAAHQIARYRDWLAQVPAHDIRTEDASDILNANLAGAVALGGAQHLGDVLDQLVRRAAGWSRPVPIRLDWVAAEHDDRPLPGQAAALATRFVDDGEGMFERAGIGLATPAANANAKRKVPGPRTPATIGRVSTSHERIGA